MSTIVQRHRRTVAVFALFVMVLTYIATVLPAATQAPGAAAEAAVVAANDGDTLANPAQDWGQISVDEVENDGQTLLADTFANGVVDTDWLNTLGNNDDVCTGADSTIAKGDITDPERTSPPPQPNGKSDICQVLIEFDPSVSDIETLYVGMLVNNGNGDMSGLVELNKVEGIRSIGDVLFALNWDGNDNASVERWTWDGAAWTDYANNAGVGQAHESRLFGEVRIPLDFIFDNGGADEECTTFVGGYVYSKTGGGNQGNANLSDSLKDVVGFDVSISNCTTVTVDVGGQCTGGGSEGAVNFEALISVNPDVPEVDVTVYSDAGMTTEVNPANLPGPGTYYWQATAEFPYELAAGDESGSFTVTDDCTETVTLDIGGQCTGGGESGAVVFEATGYTGIEGLDTITFYSDLEMTDEVNPANLPGPGTYYWDATALPGYELAASTGSFVVTDDCTVYIQVSVSGQCTGGGAEGAVSFVASGYDVTGADVVVYTDENGNGVIDGADAPIATVLPALPGPGDYIWVATAQPGYELTAGATGTFTVVDDCTVPVVLDIGGACSLVEDEAVFAAYGYEVTGVGSITFYSNAGMTDVVDPADLPGEGTYWWQATAAPGYELSATSGSFTVDVSECLAGLGDYVWYDVDEDGIQDVGEPSIPNVGVSLYSSADGFAAPIDTTLTDATGYYEFIGLDSTLDYQVVFAEPFGFDYTAQNQGADDALDSDADVDGRTASVDLAPGEFNPTIDAGFIPITPREFIPEVCTYGEGEYVHLVSGSGAPGTVFHVVGETVLGADFDEEYTVGALGTVADVIPAGSYTWTASYNGTQIDEGTLELETCPPDLAIDKVDLVDPIVLTPDTPDGEITYEITVTNADNPVTGVVVTDTLPETVTFVSASSTVGTCAHAAGVITCELGDMEPGDSATITVTVATESLGEVTVSTVLNEVEVAGNEPEENTDNNYADEPTDIVEVLPSPPELVIDKIDLVDPIVLTEDDPDGEITYVVTVENVSANPATGVVVTDTLPATTTFKSAVPDTGSCSIDGQVLTCEIGDMAGGDVVSITITVATESFGELTVPTVLNIATVTLNEPDDPSDNTADEPTDIAEVRQVLPVTGYDSGRVALLGGLVLGLGALLLMATRRRDDEATD